MILAQTMSKRVFVFVTLLRVERLRRKRLQIFRNETFRTSRNGNGKDPAIKFATWQHPAIEREAMPRTTCLYITVLT